MSSRIASGRAYVSFLAGTDIAACCVEARRLAEDISGTVNFTHNGVDMMATESDKPSAMVKRYDSRREYDAMVEKLSRGG